MERRLKNTNKGVQDTRKERKEKWWTKVKREQRKRASGKLKNRLQE